MEGEGDGSVTFLVRSRPRSPLGIQTTRSSDERGPRDRGQPSPGPGKTPDRPVPPVTGTDRVFSGGTPSSRRVRLYTEFFALAFVPSCVVRVRGGVGTFTLDHYTRVLDGKDWVGSVYTGLRDKGTSTRVNIGTVRVPEGVTDDRQLSSTGISESTERTRHRRDSPKV